MNSIIDNISQPWPWYISGLLIAGIMVILLFFGKSFGFSSNLRTLCSIAGAGKVNSFFQFEWRKQTWNILFLIGSVIGGYISVKYLGSSSLVEISESTIKELSLLGISHNDGLNPPQLFGADMFFGINGVLFLIVGGFLVGFGSRWAGGCTSGHAISGISNLQVPSVISVIGFFIGGLIMTHFLLPVILLNIV